MKRIFCVFCCFVFLRGYTQGLTMTSVANAASFPLIHANQTSPIYIDSSDYKVVSIAAMAFQNDLYEISGHRPDMHVSSSIQNNYPVIIGTIGQSRYIDELIRSGKLSVHTIKGKWESYMMQVIEKPFKNVRQALVIAGSDRRGTAFGVFDLSKRLGVSPWKWWADVHPEKRSTVYINPGKFIQSSPAVKYRGIFINDEDWGLQPWAAKNMDTDIKDIGPKTYARVFELLLRLKANYLWPAMHPCTKAFYYYKDNPKTADDYAIVVGASHCEPMLRNNVFEWAENFEHEYGKKPGEWRYDLNGPEIYNYWKDRVKESKNYESVYTVGMRGIHDGSMPGPKDMDGKVKLLQKIISDQRGLLTETFNKNPGTLPQIFCPYKEVLNVYRNGLQLPDDVTIVWADDNHGYIRQLSDNNEQKKSGRSGIYYHLSYWGSPHDYLWLSSISPALISYEMSKAYAYGADRLWVFNVGDIKPAELETQFALDLAWDINRWPPQRADQYIEEWAAATFGKKHAKEIAEIKKTYYRLAAEGKPEHLGSITFTPEQEEERIANYNRIVRIAEQVKTDIPASLQDAYYELILYPVKGAALMNEKIFYGRKSLRPGLTSDVALSYSKKAKDAFQEIQEMTARYNTEIAGGKWNGIMSWHPRDLPVFNMPATASRQYLDSMQKIRASSVTTTMAKKSIRIEAKDFITKKEFNNAALQVIDGLGYSGKGVSLSSYHVPPADPAFTKVPYAEYKAQLSPGPYTITVKCLPTQSIDNDEKLVYGISVNGEKPQLVNIHSEADGKQWKENVLRGYAEGKTAVNISKQENIIRIYFPDAGLVVNSIEIEQN